MQVLVKDPDDAQKLIEQRKQWGADKWDEVWDGIYVMASMPNNEHQELVSELNTILVEVLQRPKLGKVRPGVNVSDRDEGWKTNYRCPDVVFYPRDTRAQNCDTHWVGGPDFLIDIASPGDDLKLKLPFYERVEVREALFIERYPSWALELYRLSRGRLKSVGRSELPDAAVLTSKVVPLTFRLAAGSARPQIEVQWPAQGKTWVV